MPKPQAGLPVLSPIAYPNPRTQRRLKFNVVQGGRDLWPANAAVTLYQKAPPGHLIAPVAVFTRFTNGDAGNVYQTLQQFLGDNILNGIIASTSTSVAPGTLDYTWWNTAPSDRVQNYGAAPFPRIFMQDCGLFFSTTAAAYTFAQIRVTWQIIPEEELYC